uniref:RAP-1b n=4 Tax=Babesia TaxID=5864 RepID=A0A088NNT3_9APIC|nr:rhoptry-associated-protein 1b [Babesia sp. BQ1/Lintan]AIN51385.1 RAP-1b [Babesia sp. BQ1/Ningxian]AIN51391.1 RAP-1b [Babesia sp. Tianzhu]
MAPVLKRIGRLTASYAALILPMVIGFPNRSSRLSANLNGSMLPELLGHEGELANVSRTRRSLNKAMSQSAAYFTESVIDSVCRLHADEMQACRSAVDPYMLRCESGRCLHMDLERIKVTGSTAVELPNKFQLDCAFELYKRSPAFPLRGLRGTIARFQKGGRYAAYRDFILQLMLANCVEDRKLGDFEAFMRKYLFLAAIQYKSYLMLDNWKAKLQNMIELSQFVFVDKIERSLVQIIAKIATKSILGTPANAFDPYAECFPAYLNSLCVGHEKFAHLYSSVVFIALRSSISNTRHLELSARNQKLEPWKKFYNRYVTPVFGLFKGMYGYMSSRVMKSLGRGKPHAPANGESRSVIRHRNIADIPLDSGVSSSGGKSHGPHGQPMQPVKEKSKPSRQVRG